MAHGDKGLPASELSTYEVQRLAHIRRNHEFLVALGLADAGTDPVAALTSGPGAKKKKKATGAPPRKKAVPPPPESLRRSARLVGAAAELSHETITEAPDGFFDTEKKPAAKKRRRSDDDDGGDDSLESMREEAMRYLKACREAQLELSVDHEADGDGWRAEARRRWGALAGAGDASARDWKVFVTTRLATPPPVSPLDFLQEYYCADSWRLLAACILMSRVSSWDTKHTCISAFFQLYPTPTAFAQETDWKTTKAAIHSLGLFDDRLKSLAALTDHFLQGAPLPAGEGEALLKAEDGTPQPRRADAFDLSLDRKSPHKIHGVGPFGIDSWRVFCKDEGATIKLNKASKDILEPFVRWRRRPDVKAE